MNDSNVKPNHNCTFLKDIKFTKKMNNTDIDIVVKTYVDKDYSSNCDEEKRLIML